MTQLSLVLPIELEEDNEWFTAQFVRQDSVHLYAHIKYKKWSATAKKKTKELMDSFDEPLYAFIHDEHHLKYLDSLGFKKTGRLIKSYYPGKEGQLFSEVFYIKGGIDNYLLSLYDETCKELLPLSCVDGYGKIEKIEEALLEKEQALWTTKHHFSDGVYTRETFVPKGSILTGYRHKERTVSIVAQGCISVMAVDRQGRAKDYGVISAPSVVVTEAGLKKIGLAHEDVVFINSFPLANIPEEYHNEESMEVLEEYIFDKRGVECLE